MSLPMAERLDLDGLQGPSWPKPSCDSVIFAHTGEGELGFVVIGLPPPCVDPARPDAWETLKLEPHEVVV